MKLTTCLKLLVMSTAACALAYIITIAEHRRNVGYRISDIHAVDRYVAKHMDKPMTRENAAKVVWLYGKE